MTDTGRITEAQLLESITEAAKIGGWLLYHTHDSRHSAAGFLDLVLVRDDRLIFAELKSDTGRVSAAQQEWVDALDRPGITATVHIWRPADLAAVLELLTRRRPA